MRQALTQVPAVQATVRYLLVCPHSGISDIEPQSTLNPLCLISYAPVAEAFRERKNEVPAIDNVPKKIEEVQFGVM